jgi:hypothetical protein
VYSRNDVEAIISSVYLPTGKQVQALVSADVILPGSSSKYRLLVINLAPPTGRQVQFQADSWSIPQLPRTPYANYLSSSFMLENIKDLESLASERTIDFSEPTELYIKVADELKSTNRHDYVSRANFILEQLNDKDGRETFDKFREDWGIWNFDETILKVDDFKRGFLWRFRDHTTSWADNQKAKTWFLTSPEGIFVRRYEFWTCDNGFDECIEVREGSYKEILLSLLKDGDYEVLSSPVFSKSELTEFIKTYQPQNGDYEIDTIIEDFIEANPNYDV